MIGKQKTGHDRYVTGWRFQAVLFGNTCLNVLERNSDGALHIACLLF